MNSDKFTLEDIFVHQTQSSTKISADGLGFDALAINGTFIMQVDFALFYE